jgi:acid phosphatase type 7
MDTPFTGAQLKPEDLPACVELGVWTKIPERPPASLWFELKEVDKKQSEAIKEKGVMTFQAVGCTGCHADTQATTQVAAAMAAQVADPLRFGGTSEAVPASFLYHLGDVVYKKDKDTAGEQSPPPPPEKHHDFAQLYDTQFYEPYTPYAPPIFAIAGNHDGKDQDPDGPARKSAIHHFLKNFCGLDDGDPPDNSSSSRPPMAQPYPYWLLHTPLVYVLGLYSNVNNAGQLDNPEEDGQPQYDWLVQTLADIKKAADGKAVLLTVHYPPYSAAANFAERGNPNLGPTPRPLGKNLEPLAVLLQRAFHDSEQYPDAVLCAHAHHYQRLTYIYADGRQIPYLIVGGGGHIPVEKLTEPCAKSQDAMHPELRPQVVFPSGLSLSRGDRVELAAFNDMEFGFLRVTVDRNRQRLTGEYFTAFSLALSVKTLPALDDTFTLDLSSHTLQ